MRRVFISIGIFICVIAFCVFEVIVVNKWMDKLNVQLELAQNAIIVDDREKALEYSQVANNLWDKQHKLFAMFISHNALDDLDQSFDVMHSELENDRKEEFIIENTRLKVQVEHLRDSVLPSIYNVL